MSLANLNLVLRTRALADTGSGGLFNATTPLINAWNWHAVPEDTTFPYVVQTVAGYVAEDAFQLDIERILVRFSIWHERESQTDADPFLTVSNIEARIRGNWSSASPGTAPTYGFHRFTPTFTGETGTTMGRVQIIDNSDGDYINLIAEYKLWLSS